jgi:sulfate transport system substrate-binding protein
VGERGVSGAARIRQGQIRDRVAAEAYLKYWYTKDGQEIAARNSYRPRDPEIAKEYEKSFAKVELFTIDDVFGGWTKAQKDHFGEGGIFDQIYKN